jgi:NADPH:quinone reductase-like Zn-dependent oxidoreductase
VKAARLVAFGEVPSFEMQETADPEPGAGQVVVDLFAAALNHRDIWVYKKPGYCPLPVTLGSDGAGVVAAVGPSVHDVSVGDEVVINASLGWERGRRIPGAAFDILGAPTDGTFAEKVLVDAIQVTARPEHLTWVEAASVNLAGLTAWRATTTCAEAGPGRSILVTGAGGGVSTFAIQIASSLGADVYVTSSTEEKIERAHRLGAKAGFLYQDPEWPQQARSATRGGFDAAIDSFGGPAWDQCLKALRNGGVLVSFGDTGAPRAAVEGMDIFWGWRSIVGTTMGSPEEYEAMVEHVRAGSWRPVIDSVFALERIADALNRLERAPERFGKVAISIR